MHMQLLNSAALVAAGKHTHVHHIKRLQRSLYLFFCLRATEKKKGPGYFRSPSLKREERFHLKPRPYTYAQSVLTSIVSWPTSLYTHTQTHRRKDAQTHCPVRIMCLLLLSRMEGGKSTVVYQPQEKLYRKPSSVERSQVAGQKMHQCVTVQPWSR